MFKITSLGSVLKVRDGLGFVMLLPIFTLLSMVVSSKKDILLFEGRLDFISKLNELRCKLGNFLLEK